MNVVCRCAAGIAVLGYLAASASPAQVVASEVPASANATDVLARLVTLDVTHVTLERAIEALAASANVRVQYQRESIVGVTKSVTLHADKLPLGAAFDHILAGTGLRAAPLTRDVIDIKPSTRDVSILGGGVSGTVVSAKTARPIRGASVALDDSAGSTRTDENGRYRFANVTGGTHRVSIRSVGFARQAKLVTVVDDQVATANFSLESSVNTLDQVVVTATGEQRIRELGHVVAQINADSVVREAPVTNLGELLTARVPGLQVLTSNGAVAGGDVSLRIRGTSTTALDPQPIVIVDGVRYRTSNFNGSGVDARPFSAEQRSPLNDLNVNDIEKIEVVKGPSASTLYGPDAANGVIVVTTKQGHAGKPEWHVYAYPDLSTLNLGSDGQLGGQRSYQGWGHVPNTTTLYGGQCDIQAQAAKLCVLDSLTMSPLPTNDPNLSIIAKQRPQWHSGASVSGGAPGVSYFFSGNYDSETGALHLSPQAKTTLENQLGVHSLGDAIRNPNIQQATNFQTNISSQLNATSTVGLTAHYTQATQRAIDVSDLLAGQYLYSAPPPGLDSAALSQYRNSSSAATSFLATTQEQVRRVTATLHGTIQPLSWLNMSATAGTDIDNTTDAGVVPPDQFSVGDPGQVFDDRRSSTNRNAHLGATAAATRGIWSFRTSLGGDYSYTNLDGLLTQGSGLAPGSSDITTASSQSVSRSWNETASLGAYSEEQIGLNDRLFLTASLRLDGSTSFGDSYHPRPFPKAGLSWVISDESFLKSLRQHGLDELRLRYSFGASSRYPTSAMKLGTIFPQSATIEGTTHSTFFLYNVANPLLRPERSREAEYGADMTVVSNLRIGVTWYNRRTNQQLQLLGAPDGIPGGWANVGDLSARGFEMTVDATIFDAKQTTLDLALTYANTTNTVISVGAANQFKSLLGSVVVGYPINSAFGSRTIGYVDSVGGQGADGFISARSEVQSSPIEYLGQLVAPRTYTLTPRLGLLGGRVRLSTLFDRQAGGVQYDYATRTCIYNYTCTATFLKSTPLLRQAQNLNVNGGDFVTSSDFTRWREFNITGDLPPSLRRRLRLSHASMSVQVRNLALWTSFKTLDPESVPGLGTTAVGEGGNGALGIPQPRTWTIRFDVSP